LVFENATTESAAIYLTDDVGQWFVGHAEPGRITRFRWPAALGARSGREFSLLVVRAGGRRDQAGLRSGRADVTRSERIPGDHLMAIRWKLADRQLVATRLLPPPSR
jgi:hypothetical protein